MTFCPHCGQPLLIRYGVKLTPKKAELMDLIERRAAGVAIGTLAETLYPGAPANRAYERVKTTVCQINDLLAATDYRIVSRAGLYHLERGNG
jgi:DNA-binding SARP family transcriptional activator